MKFLTIALGIFVVLGLSLFLYQMAQSQSTYQGLPTVACLDYTKPVVENFSFTINIKINGQNYPLGENIGHDSGNCLHDIFTNDPSGRVFIHSNDKETFTLGQFFDVWRETFSQKQIFGYQAINGGQIQVFVDGKAIDTYRDTVLLPNEVINIIYK